MTSMFPAESLNEQMLDRYGPMLGGKNLYAALGFKSYASFHRGKQRGEIYVNVFTLPGRRGWFALTTEVATWLAEQANPVNKEQYGGDAK